MEDILYYTIFVLYKTKNKMKTVKNNLIPALIVSGVLVVLVMFGSYLYHATEAGLIHWNN